MGRTGFPLAMAGGDGGAAGDLGSTGREYRRVTGINRWESPVVTTVEGEWLVMH